MGAVWDELRLTEVVKAAVFEAFQIDLSDKPASMPIADLGVDSMGLLDIIMRVEDVVGLRIDNIELPKNPTLHDVVVMVLGILAAAKPGKAYGTA
jgi:acyl carrier protein